MNSPSFDRTTFSPLVNKPAVIIPSKVDKKTAENLSTDWRANGYLLAKSALSIGWQPAELAGQPRPRPLTSYQPTYVFGDVEYDECNRSTLLL